MIRHKRAIAKVLAMALIVTSINLSWCDLSVFADNLDDAITGITDGYAAYKDALKGANDFRNPKTGSQTKRLQKYYDVDQRNKDALGTIAATHDYTAKTQVPDWKWRKMPASTNNAVAGIQTYNQNDVNGPSGEDDVWSQATITPGEWMTNLHYDPTSGTPTTEDVFVTMGGSQFLVQLQYRIIQAPYIRTYRFEADAPNYRYYELADPGHFTTATPNGVKFVTAEGLKSDWKPDDVTGFTIDQPDASRDQHCNNYSYKFYEGADGPKKSLDALVGEKDDQGRNGVMKEHKVTALDGHTYTLVTSQNDDFSFNHLGGKWKSYNDTSVDCDLNGSFYTPNEVQALKYQAEAIAAIKEFKKVWTKQKDNYRADEGDWNIHSAKACRMDPINELADRSRWMYTYSGMCRYNTVRKKASPNQGNTYNKGDYAVNGEKAIWNPAIVSYNYDWKQLKVMNNGGFSDYGADQCRFRSMGQVRPNEKLARFEIAKDVMSIYNAGLGAGGNGSGIGVNCNTWDYFALNPANSKFARAVNGGHADENTQDFATKARQSFPCELYFANRAAKQVGGNITVAINDYANCYAFGAPLGDHIGEAPGLSGNNYSSISPNWGSSGFYDIRTNMLSNSISQYLEATSYGMNDVAYMFYRGVYSILIEYGAFLYYEDAVKLFDGIPGFTANGDAATYNKHVAENLMACFGGATPMLDDGQEDKVTVVFASFPLGGDLDGGMEDNTSTRVDSSISFGCGLAAFNPCLVEPEYAYSVSFGVKMKCKHGDKAADKIAGYSNDKDVKGQRFYQSRHGNGLPAGGLPCKGYLEEHNVTQLPYHSDDCWGFTDAAHSNSTLADKCPTCHGTKSQTCPTCNGAKTVTHTACSGSGKVICTVCSGTGYVETPGPNSTTVDTACTACSGSGEVRCTGCRGSGKVRCTGCRGTGKVTCKTCNGKGWKDGKNNSPSHTPAASTETDTEDGYGLKWCMHYDIPSGGYAEYAPGGEYADHSLRMYTEQYKVDTSHSISVHKGMWESVEAMSDRQILKQKFNNVKYLDITSWKIWCMKSGTVRGLNKILASPVDIKSMSNLSRAKQKTGDNPFNDNNYIISKALDKIGFSILNVDDANWGLTGGGGDGGYWTHNGISEKLQAGQRVANSFNYQSLGNHYYPEFVLHDKGETYSDNSSYRGNITPFYAYRKSDCPALGLTNLYKQTDDTYQDFVNGDPAAYTYDGGNASGDYLVFKYHPMLQGGRSNTTFYGFVSQALAHTLFWKPVSAARPDGSFSSADPAVGYGNSLRVQGDYMTLFKLFKEHNPSQADMQKASNFLTVAGSMYDMWQERFKQGGNSGQTRKHNANITDYDNSTSGKFALAPDSVVGTLRTGSQANSATALAFYLSSMAWIPGQLYRCLARSSYHDIYNQAGIDCTIDCYMIHTYCRGINASVTTAWDHNGGTPLQAFATNHCDTIIHAPSDMGNVNPRIGPRLLGHSDSHAFKLTQMLSDWSSYMDIWGGSAGPIQNGVQIEIPITNYLKMGMNTPEAMTDLNVKIPHVGNISSDVPYNKDIVLDPQNPDKEVSGYDSGTKTYFEWNNTFVSSKHNIDTKRSGYVHGAYRDSGDNNNLPKSSAGASNSVWDMNSGTTPSIKEVVNDPTKPLKSVGWEGFGIKFGDQPDPRIWDTCEADGGSNIFEDSQGKKHNFTRYYPWITDINLSRYLPNNVFCTGAASVNYDFVNEHCDDSTKSSVAKVGSDRVLNEDRGISRIGQEYYMNVGYSKQDKMIHMPAQYVHNEDTCQDQGTLKYHMNDLVIYNPLSTQSATLMPASKYSPGATNIGAYYDPKINNYRYEYKGAYMHSFLNLVQRDLRIGYAYGLSDKAKDGEQYVEGGGVYSPKTEQQQEQHLVLKPISTAADHVIDMHDYKITAAEDEVKNVGNSETASYVAVADGDYIITHAASKNSYTSSKVYLHKGDTVKFDEYGSVTIIPNYTKNVDIRWDALTKAYKQLQETFKNDVNYAATHPKVMSATDESMTQGLYFYKDATLTIGGDTDFKMRKGAMLSFSIDISDTDESGYTALTDALKYNSSTTDYNCWLSKEKIDNGKKMRYTIYYEAKVDNCVISQIDITFRKDCYVWASSANMAKSYGVTVLRHKDGKPLGTMSTLQYHTSTNAGSINSTEVTTFRNVIAGYATGEAAFTGYAGSISAGLWVRHINTDCTVTLNITNPHSVPSTYWKYYVLGWQTSSGITITNINQSVLQNSSTILVTPNGSTITVGEILSLLNSGQLYVVMFPGAGYSLIKKSDLPNFKSSITGYEIGGSDPMYGLVDFTLGGVESDDHIITYKKEWNKGNRDYTITSKSAALGDDLHLYMLEEVFKCENVAGKAAYSVRKSYNQSHKYAPDGSNPGDYNYDYSTEYVDKIVFTSTELEKVSGDYLSLDDEFVLYWDNYLDTDPNDTDKSFNTRTLNKSLGRGFDDKLTSRADKVKYKVFRDSQDADFDDPKHDDQWELEKHSDGFISKGTQISDWSRVKTYPYWKTYLNTVTGSNVIDTTKWIYRKYVIFNVDVYAFTEYDKDWTYHDNYSTVMYKKLKWNPTTPAYNSDGKPNHVVFIPKGQKVYLGYYVEPKASDPEANNTAYPSDDYVNRDTSMSNKGLFFDYGAGGTYDDKFEECTGGQIITKDPNGQLFTYHFWCPLSNGELDNIGSVQYIVEGINSQYKSCTSGDTHGNTNWASQYQSPTAYQTSDTSVVPNSELEKMNRKVAGSKYRGWPIPTNNYTCYADYDTNRTENLSTYFNTRALYDYRIDDNNKVVVDDWNDDVLNGIRLPIYSNMKPLKYGSGWEYDRGGQQVKPAYVDSCQRPGDVKKFSTFSVAGRVGNMTIVDSTDPRFQDTFKIGSELDEWAVAPIVRRITQFTNDDPEHLKNLDNPNGAIYNEARFGSQNRILTDVADVRGRLLRENSNSNLPKETYDKLDDKYKYTYDASGNKASDPDYPLKPVEDWFWNGWIKYRLDSDTYGKTFIKSGTAPQNARDPFDISSEWYSKYSYAYKKKVYNNDYRAGLLPLTPNFNIHQELSGAKDGNKGSDLMNTTDADLTYAKVGYNLLCSVTTTGNYFGSRSDRNNGDKEINASHDKGQTKVQVHPSYSAYNPETKKWIAVDVYVPQGNEYKLINAGCSYPTAEAAQAKNATDEHGPYYMDASVNEYVTSKIATNTNKEKTEAEVIADGKYYLDDNMLRRSITTLERQITYSVLHEGKKPVDNPGYFITKVLHKDKDNNVSKKHSEITTSLLDVKEDKGNNADTIIGATSLDPSYIYGNAQMMYLREWNRTFIGGNASAINETSYVDSTANYGDIKDKKDIQNYSENGITKGLFDNSGKKSTTEEGYGFAKRMQYNAKLYAQKWYFDIGLPSNAVFVPHGTDIRFINKYRLDLQESGWYVLCMVDVIAMGYKWMLHYTSPSSGSTIYVDKQPWSETEYNPYYKEEPFNVPVAIYDISKSAAGDKGARGSH